MTTFVEEIVPLEKWEEFTNAYSAQMAVENARKRPVPVKTFQYKGYFYTVFWIHHGPYGNERWGIIGAYRLLPPELYQGETTQLYHDEDAIEAGLRQRGDHTGLIVSASGRHLVCAQAVHFKRSLPRTVPLSQAEADVFDLRCRRTGWRAIRCKALEPEWRSVAGHPVAVYQHADESRPPIAALLWRHGERIQELILDETVELDAPNAGVMVQPILAGRPVEQLSLF